MIKNLFSTLIAMTLLCGIALYAQDKTTKEESKKMESQTTKETPGSGQKEIVVMETSMGTIEIEMFRNEAPKTVENFVKLAEKGYYNGITFHRVIDNFMIQGGDPTGTGMGGESIYGKKFEDEISPKLKFDREGLLAMANAGKNTNGSQFFITLVPTTWLNGNHTIFGEVVKGMDIVKAIGKVKTSKPGDKPVTPVVMNKVYSKNSKKKEETKSK
ncbi:MAG: peptidylprolyl isomerase [Bacteroidetes bacterium]|nr:MAG: peptidylprolyl isomerase [Bacteroidota bacterium]